ncbi:MAG: FecR domain-containing protein [Planctomycetes bacterium]|nr:FecR domain-containing protein [Planctomycetota bacterium]
MSEKVLLEANLGDMESSRAVAALRERFEKVGREGGWFRREIDPENLQEMELLLALDPEGRESLEELFVGDGELARVSASAREGSEPSRRDPSGELPGSERLLRGWIEDSLSGIPTSQAAKWAKSCISGTKEPRGDYSLLAVSNMAKSVRGRALEDRIKESRFTIETALAIDERVDLLQEAQRRIRKIGARLVRDDMPVMGFGGKIEYFKESPQGVQDSVIREEVAELIRWLRSNRMGILRSLEIDKKTKDWDMKENLSQLDSSLTPLDEDASMESLRKRVIAIAGVFCSTVHGISGSVKIISPYHLPRKAVEDEILTRWDKVVTGERSGVKIQLCRGRSIEMGSDSALQLYELEPLRDRFLLNIMQGRARVRIADGGKVEVRTPTAQIALQHGFADIIISALNTLIAPREGMRAGVASKKARKWIETGTYGLITMDGDIVISKAATETDKAEFLPHEEREQQREEGAGTSPDGAKMRADSWKEIPPPE